ncbi:acyl-homoserine-lactone synthase [Chitinimonas koreensis]|uniref:acyl-homoserine-lactone synthase n=1 Tax=Chitinimonas koreensis TaxID=356302 RepID=UPI000410DFC4|nr:acyl-homoserine-lactone synthase [Chitinimonas koreensis]QNM95828.1 GNAT family N-acetyltransferase [Chitinimonas koreensis]
MQILISRRDAGILTQNLETEMYKLRYRVFRERLNWEVAVQDGQERDDYDDCNPVYMLVRNDAELVLGCWRLLPSTGPYMLKDTFPELLYGQDAPVGPDVWELSRFAMTTEGVGGFGFSDTPIHMMQAVTRFARAWGIKRYVTVTTVAIERMLRRLGLKIERFGPPMQVGIERAVAFTIEMDDAAFEVLCGPETEARLAGNRTEAEAAPRILIAA